MTDQAATVALVPKHSRLRESEMQLAEHGRNSWLVTPAAGVPIEALLAPEFWAHVAPKLKPLDRIEAISQDGSWEADFRVLYVGRTEARLSKISFVSHAQVDPSVLRTDTHDVSWGGPAHKWRVVRKSDGEVVSKGHATEAQALAAMTEHLKSLSA